ncbi:MAG: hypothetical protein LBO64_10375, partial [Desulfovibrio sp.]|nr:hypothetical protein [Desulfovibrio sp.]
ATSPDFLLSRFSLQKGLRKVGLFSTPIRTSVGHFCTPMNRLSSFRRTRPAPCLPNFTPEDKGDVFHQEELYGS